MRCARFIAAGFVLLTCTGSPLLWASQSAASAHPVEKPAWQAAIDARRQQLIQQNGPGTNFPLRDDLIQMREQDQAARGFTHGEMPKERLRMATNLAAIDAALTERLKVIVAAQGWPTIALVGMDASAAAMLLLTHTADHAWQLQLLPELTTLADQGKIDGSSLALVIDKELVSEGRLQRYGSQFKFLGDQMAMYGVEEPAGLDRRRARSLLPPIEVYKQLLAQLYHLRVSDKVVSATLPTTVP